MEEAMKIAAENIRNLKYGKDGYIWVDTYEGINVVYLGKDTERKTRLNDIDANGVAYIKSIIENTQEISAGMEETAASANQVSITSDEIEAAVNNIAVKAQEGSEEVIEISKRAEEMKIKAIKSKQYVQEIYDDTKIKLLEAIIWTE